MRARAAQRCDAVLLARDEKCQMRSDCDASPGVLATADGYAGHYSGSELRNDVHLRRIGQPEGPQSSFQSIDELLALSVGGACIARQRRELIADALDGFGNGRCEFTQITPQARREAKRIVGTSECPVTQLQVLQ